VNNEQKKLENCFRFIRAITITDVEVDAIIEEHGTTATVIAEQLRLPSVLVKELARQGKAKREAVKA